MGGLVEADPDAVRLGHYADLLFGQALIQEGSVPAEPNRFNEALLALMID
jgi:HSP90 family molecular chaperone